MEIINHSETDLHIHHIPKVPWTRWFVGMVFGLISVALLLWGAKFVHLGIFAFGMLFFVVGMLLWMPDEQHILWVFNKQEGTLTVKQDERTRQDIRQYALHEIRQATLLTRASLQKEQGHVVRSEVMLRFNSGEDIVLPMTDDNTGWFEKQALVDTINVWLGAPTTGLDRPPQPTPQAQPTLQPAMHATTGTNPLHILVERLQRKKRAS
jgi:hypothetical protein